MLFKNFRVFDCFLARLLFSPVMRKIGDTNRASDTKKLVSLSDADTIRGVILKETVILNDNLR